MEKVLYLDCTNGISEEGLLGALLHLGADLAYLHSFVQKLPFGSFNFEIESVNYHGIATKKVSFRSGVAEKGDSKTRATEILDIVNQSDLPENVKRNTYDVLQSLTRASSNVSEVPFQKVDFLDHEWKIWTVKIIGVCLALESLGIQEVLASSVLISKRITLQGNQQPSFSEAAVIELLKGIPISEVKSQLELTTIVGASLLKTLVKNYSAIEQIKIEKIGYGISSQDNIINSNMARVFILESSNKEILCKEKETILVLEFQVDDMTGEALGYLMGELLEAGALDVYYTPVYMKKNRPGTLVTVLSSLQNAERCEEVILTETTTLGVRKSLWSRRILDRKIINVDTDFGTIRLKQAFKDGKIIRQIPEYEDVQKAAKKHGVPFYEVYNRAARTGRE